MELALRILREDLLADLMPLVRRGGLLENLANALEGNRQGLEIARAANRAQRLDPALRVHEIVCAGAENRVDLVIGKLHLLPKDESRAVEEEFQDARFAARRYGEPRRRSGHRLEGCTHGRRERERQFAFQEYFDDSVRRSAQ